MNIYDQNKEGAMRILGIDPGLAIVGWGVIEAVGPEAGLLAAQVTPGKPWRTIPSQTGRPMGSIKPLAEEYREVMEQNPCFLNLMYN